MAICKSCGAEIIFIKTSHNTSIPCDPAIILYRRSTTGSKTVVTRNGEVIKADIVSEAYMHGEGYISHFATCPDASAHRKVKEKPGEQVRMSDVFD